jgi:hypothetical protein
LQQQLVQAVYERYKPFLKNRTFMKTSLKSLIFLLLFFSCNNSKEKTLTSTKSISEKDIYLILQMVLKDMKPNEILEGTDYYILNELQKPSFVEDHIFLSKKIDSIFSKEDLRFINEQIAERKTFIVSEDSIKPKKIISKNLIDSIKKIAPRKNEFIEKYRAKFGLNFYTIFSLPVFSKDKQTVLIDIYDISGGKTIVYKNLNNKWNQKVICNWVSD